MTQVTVERMPASFRKFSPRFRPRPPPIFQDGDPAPADVQLARDLFMALDDESKRWYRGFATFKDLLPD